MLRIGALHFILQLIEEGEFGRIEAIGESTSPNQLTSSAVWIAQVDLKEIMRRAYISTYEGDYRNLRR